MGSKPTGPVPKRSEQRIRRNKEGGPIDKVTAIGNVPVPELDIESCHPMIQDLYDSMTQSGQARYFEPSDWQYARFTLHFANRLINSGKPSSQMLAAVNAALSELLVSEGSRRRMRLEVERESEGGQLVDVAEMFRERMRAA